jgi:tRNA threonylcarbamoyladenosine biosynthesis protein TsaB
MALLAFDTCFGAVSVAVRYRAANGDWTIREAYEARQTGHAERLMPMIAEVMASAGLEFEQIECFAVTVGPGSFTGVRVGVAAARTFALAAAQPVVGISSLEVIAARGRQLLGTRGDGRTLMVAVDARRGGLYCALHRDGITGGDVVPRLLTPEAAATVARDYGALVIGSGGPLIADYAATAGHTIDTELASIEPHARFLALLAADRPFDPHPASTIAPLYLRSPDVRPQPGPIARQP